MSDSSENLLYLIAQINPLARTLFVLNTGIKQIEKTEEALKKVFKYSDLTEHPDEFAQWQVLNEQIQELRKQKFEIRSTIFDLCRSYDRATLQAVVDSYRSKLIPEKHGEILEKATLTHNGFLEGIIDVVANANSIINPIK